MFSNYINDFKLILMFSIFMLDDTYLSTEDPIDMLDLMEMLHDVDILHSNNLNEAFEKTKSKLKEEVVRLLFSHPQMNETKSKLECFLFRVKCLDVRCRLFNYKSISLTFFSYSYM